MLGCVNGHGIAQGPRYLDHLEIIIMILEYNKTFQVKKLQEGCDDRIQYPTYQPFI